MADVPLMNNPMTTQGDTLHGGASGTPTRLAKGTAGQVLTMNAGATAPEWATPSSGGSASGAGAYNSTNLALSTSGEAAITMDSESSDTDAYHSTATNTSRLTVPSGLGGLFIVTVCLRLSANVNGYVVVRKNGSAGTILLYALPDWNSTNGFGACVGANAVVLSAADYIEMYAVMSASCNAVAPGAGPTPWFSITRIGS